MKPKFEIIEGKSYHCGQMARLIRDEHTQALVSFGIDLKTAHQALVDSFTASSFRRAWLIDGKLAGLGGVHGMLASSTGFIWLALTQAATKYPIEIIKEARRQIDDIMQTRCQLTTSVINRDETAMRFAEFLGFEAAENVTGSVITNMIYVKDED